MGTISRRANGRYQVKIRRHGSSLSRTFDSLDAARRWERAREVDLDLGVDIGSRADLRKTRLRELIDRWLEEVLPHRASARYEESIVRWLHGQPVSAQPLSFVTQTQFRAVLASLQETKTPGGALPSPDTVIRKWSVIRAVLNHVRDEWGYDHWAHPMRGIRLPAPSPHRVRRWTPADIRRLIAAWRIARRDLVIDDNGGIHWQPFKDPRARGGCRNRYVPLIVRLAWETGIRRSEMLSIRVDNLRLGERRLWLEASATKNGEGRWVPLTRIAINLIERAMGKHDRAQDEALLFPVTLNAFKCAWRAIMRCARLNEEDIRFHDSRREAISRCVDAGLSLPQVLALLGHKDLRAAKRYFAPDLAAVSDALDSRRAVRAKIVDMQGGR